MTDARTILGPLLSLDADALTGWFLRCALRRGSDPLRAHISNYDSAIHLVLDFLPELRDVLTSRRFGDSAFAALRLLFELRERTSESLAEEAANPASELLFAIESLPLSEDVAHGGISFLLLLLANRSYRLLNSGELDLRARLLLGVAAHISVASVRPELAYVLSDDLTNVAYVVPAFSIALRVNPHYAMSRIADAIMCLRSSDLPTRHLIFEIARMVAIWPQSRSVIFAAVAHLGMPTAKDEFVAALRRTSNLSLVQEYEDIAQTASQSGVNSLLRSTVSDACRVALQVEDTTDASDFDRLLTDSLHQHDGDPVKVGRAVGSLYANSFAVSQQLAAISPNSFDPPVKVPTLVRIIKYLDNGEWSTRATLADGKPIPRYFAKESQRRLVAAHIVRSAIKESQQSRGERAFEDAVRISKLPQLIDHAFGLLPQRNLEPLRMTVSPFPEDRLIYHVLSIAAREIKGLKIAPYAAPWSEPSTVNRDLTMMNEWADNPEVRQRSAQHNIFQHRGYYIFTSSLVPDTAEDRLALAFDLGVERYFLAEYPEMFRRIRQRFRGQLTPNHSHRAPEWTKDFEHFISGESKIYVGGSINARLLLRLWSQTKRIRVLCDPNEIANAVGAVPWNRLVIGSKLLALAKGHRNQFEDAMVKVFREAGTLLRDWAHQASHKRDPTAQAIISHFLALLSPAADDKPRGIMWNFTVTEEDVVSLILEDNHFESNNR